MRMSLQKWIASQLSENSQNTNDVLNTNDNSGNTCEVGEVNRAYIGVHKDECWGKPECEYDQWKSHEQNHDVSILIQMG